jgi:acyl-CoA synthetase (AMP-forming)/AMP-acid ligase II
VRGTLPIQGALRDGAARSPKITLTFVTTDGTESRTSSGMIIEHAERLAVRLRAAGLRPGDPLAVRGGGSPEIVTILLAGLLGGLTVVPVLHTLGPADVEHICIDSGARMLLSLPAWRNRDYAGELSGFAACPVVICPRTGPDLDRLETPLAGPARHAPNGPEMACVVYSSGTTGHPKGVVHSGATLLAEAVDFGTALGVLEDGVMLQTFPVAHIGGFVCLVMAVALGVPTVFLESWDAPLAGAAIARHRVTALGSTPTFVRTLLDLPDADLMSLRRIMSGGTAVPPTLVEEADRRGITVFRAYGSSEHPTVTGLPDPPTLAARAYTDGRPTRGSQVRIEGADGLPVPAGQDGQILVRGPEQFLRYLHGESAPPDDWFRTGDLGHVDVEGNLVVTGRAKDILIRGGENVSLVEVEHALLRHPDIVDAAVTPVPDQYLGERGCAVLVLRPGASVGLEEIRAHFTGLGLASYKTPKFVRITERLPRSDLGKLDRVRVRELGKHDR